LSQTENRSIKDIVLSAYGELLQQQEEIDELLKKIETDYSEDHLVRLNELQDHFQTMGGYAMESNAEEVLEGLGFQTEELNRDLDTFSGGWRMRVLLAKMLLQRPSLLMLDEPTNHLDLPSIEWLENYLKTYPGSIIVVSHDQDFINNVSETIVEVAFQKLTRFPGNYDNYLQMKEERSEIQMNAYLNQQKKIKDTEKFINRFRAKATKARQVQSRVKALEKMDMVDAPEEDTQAISIDFPVKVNPGKNILDINLKDKSYGKLQVLKDSDLHIHRGQKIALIGANGKGNSTLLRILMGTEAFEGDRKPGHNVAVEFYAQHQLEALNIKNDIITEMQQSGLQKTDLEIRTLLGAFLFTGDDIYKKIKVLSGGEKSRVALAKTLLGDANFLLLDEPTNHLDIDSTEILIEALKRYTGTFIIVSHNRHFISAVANEIWYIEDKEVKSYPGGYDEYIHWVAKKNSTPKQDTKKVKPVKAQKPKSVKKEKPVNTQKLEKLEKEIETLENSINSIEEKLADPATMEKKDELNELLALHNKESEKLESKMSEWESLIG
jgi:ATP-binding cassette subfamily F protein 3